MASSSLSALVIATATGAPMRSERPKPIHLLAGRPMLRYVLDVVEAAGADTIAVVTGPAGDRVSKRILEDPPTAAVAWVEQRFERGTADAAQLGLTGFDDFDDDADVLVVPADLPLLRTSTLKDLLAVHRESGAVCTVLTSIIDGGVTTAMASNDDRVVRDRHGRVSAVRRAEDLVDDERAGLEAAHSVFCVRRSLLAPAARRVRPDANDGMQRLHEIVAVLAESGHPVESAPVLTDLSEIRSVDSRLLLAEAEQELRRRTNRAWLQRGVTMIDPERTYIDATVRLGTDVTLFPGTILQGNTEIADGCEIGPDTRLDRCRVGRDSVVEKTMARLATIGVECRVGPFAVVEPGAELTDGTVTGPFYAARAGE